MDDRWIILAREENRFCPECGRPVAKKYWKACIRRGHCFDCHFATHWSDNLGAGGSARFDNRSTEDDLNYRNS